MLCCGARGCASGDHRLAQRPGMVNIALDQLLGESRRHIGDADTGPLQAGRNLQGEPAQRAARVVAQQDARAHCHRVLPGPQVHIKIVGKESDRLPFRVGCRSPRRREWTAWPEVSLSSTERERITLPGCSAGLPGKPRLARMPVAPQRRTPVPAAATAANHKYLMNPNPSASSPAPVTARSCRLRQAFRRCRAAS